MTHSSEPQAALPPYVSASWLRDRMTQPNLVILDVRPYNEYVAAHLPGAIWSSIAETRLRSSDDEAVAQFQEATTAELQRVGITGNEDVVCYENFSGTAAARAVWVLEYLGHQRVTMLDGGMLHWQASGYSFAADQREPTASEFTARPQHHLLARAETIMATVAQQEDRTIVPLDTRAAMEHEAGTIPHSIHIEWLQNLARDGRFLPLEDLRALYAEAGLSPSDGSTIATYCGSGYRAAHSYVVLKALGYARVANYAPSWSEWGRRTDTPVIVP